MAQSTLERPEVVAPSIAHACEPMTSGPVRAETPVGSGPGRVRLRGIDAARGLALLGMMVVHILPATGADNNLTLPWALSVGKASALFAVVAGVGIAMTTGRPERLVGRRYAAASASLVARAVAIGILGLLLGFVVPSENALVILPYYAILFLLAIPLIRLERGQLVALTVGIIVLVPIASHLWRAVNGGVTGDLTNPTLSTVASQPWEVLNMLLVTGGYPALAWTAYICAGLAIGRSALALRSSAAAVMVLGVLIAGAASLGSWFLLEQAGGRAALDSASTATSSVNSELNILAGGAEGTLPTDTGWWLATDVPHSGTPFDLLLTIGIAMAVLGAMILLCRAAGGLMLPLTAVGSMPLTMYTTHLLLLVQPWMPSDATVAFMIQLVALTTLALVWSAYFRRGPLEHLVRVVSLAAGRRVSSGGSGAGGQRSATRTPGRHRVERNPLQVT
ncbi:MAG: heparan-alpha-glucosaminide N-acetyltransferase domain-containing protein [Ornithinimicrobium sp.]